MGKLKQYIYIILINLIELQYSTIDIITIRESIVILIGIGVVNFIIVWIFFE